jgi:hypothetical protein
MERPRDSAPSALTLQQWQRKTRFPNRRIDPRTNHWLFANPFGLWLEWRLAISLARCAKIAQDISPRLTRITIPLEFFQRLVQRLSFGRRRLPTTNEVGFVQFSKTSEQLRTLTRCKLWKFFQNFRFTHIPKISPSAATSKPIHVLNPCNFDFGLWPLDFRLNSPILCVAIPCSTKPSASRIFPTKNS